MTATALDPVRRLRTYASFVRFEHTLFSLPLILAGVFSAPGPAMSAGRWALVAIAAIGARTAAMAINRLVDRRLDALNPRTRGRELPSGAMKLVEGMALLVVSITVYVLACAALGPWFLKVSPVPLIAFTVYPYLKRFTPLCHFGVGAALALAPLAGYAAAHPDLSEPWAAVWLSAFALLWVSGFDIIYATLDEEFDRAHGVHSLVAWLGRAPALRVSAFLHAAAFACLVGAALAVRSSGLFEEPIASAVMFVGLAVTATLLFLEQRWAENVNLAFFKVNVWVGMLVFLTVLAARIES
jgi:4-hydroxybenzoate polyprenyltransferase